MITLPYWERQVRRYINAAGVVKDKLPIADVGNQVEVENSWTIECNPILSVMQNPLCETFVLSIQALWKLYWHGTHQIELTALPTEILARIVTELSWRDVLRVRKTCRQLCNITKTRSIWEHLLMYEIQLQPKPFAILERPIDMHTSLELEQRLLRWKRAELVYDDHSAPVQQGLPQMRIRINLDPSAHSIHILRGRWLLSCEFHSGAVVYFDLSAPKAKILIPEVEGYPEVLMSVDEDWESPVLTFRIILVLLIPADGRRALGERRSRIDVWEGSVVLNGNNDATDIQVHLLARVPILTWLGDPTESISHIDTLVAYSVRLISPDVVIFDWKDPGLGSRCLRKTIPYDQRLKYISDLRLLPKDRIIVADHASIVIWDHSSIPYQDTRPSYCAAIPLIRLDVLLDIGPAFSRIFFLPNCMRLVFCKKKGIFGLTITEDEVQGLQVDIAELLVFPPHCSITDVAYGSPYLAYNHALCWPRRRWTESIVASYDWPEEHRVGRVGCSMRTADQCSLLPGAMQLDLTSGKLAFVLESGNLVVEDLVPP